MYDLSMYFPMKQELFQNTAVDGSTSCIPGLSNFDEDTNGDEEVDNEAEGTPADEEGFLNSPPSTTSSRKRASSTTDTASSPDKTKKSSSGKYYARAGDTVRACF